MAGFELIEDTVLGSAAASITFNTGLTDYTKFRLTLYVIKDGTAGNLNVRINGDTGTNYAYQLLAAGGNSASGSRFIGQSSVAISNGNVLSAELVFVLAEISKPLTSTPARMTVQTARRGGANIELGVFSAEWNNTTDLISSITILASSGNFAAGTRAVLEAV